MKYIRRRKEEDCSNLEFSVTMQLDEAKNREKVAAGIPGVSFIYYKDPKSDRFVGITSTDNGQSLEDFNTAIGNVTRKVSKEDQSSN